MKNSWVVAIALVGASLGGCLAIPGTMMSANMMNLSATLAPGAGIASTGKGAGTFTYDIATHTMTYTVAYEGLTGPAVAAHIHGPADAGANAPPVVPFPAPASPIAGTATLTDEQAADLLAGKYYVNVHTSANKGGEIRGQILLTGMGR
jgi:hypothetical protein